MTADERLEKAKAANPEWFAAYYDWHGQPVDRSPEGVAKHKQMQAEFAEKLAAVEG